jgi:UDP-N-acetylmuramoyl-tripeptide--D-alanyl-D-alanine ligase
MHWTADKIAAVTGGLLIYGDPARSFTGVGIDSRTIAPDQVFVAVTGEKHDGHRFVPQVVDGGVRGVIISEDARTELDHEALEARGVACVVVADTVSALGRLAAHQRQQAAIPVVAVTGSNGKTSTRQMTALVMSQRFHTLATEGNLNNEIGVPLTLFKLNDRHQAAVLELGMNHTGEIDRLGAICKPSMGIITNVAPAHLAFLGSLEGVARAKGELIAHIDSNGALVLNRDDPHLVALAGTAPCRVFFFGLKSSADVSAANLAETARGVAFDLVLPGARVRIQLRTPGRFMVANALAAAAAGHLAGLTAGEIKAGLESFAGVKGRLHVISAPNGVKVIDDTYNANPGSMAAAFGTLAALKGSQPACIVLGDMLELGPQAEDLHYQVGRQAAGSGALKLYLYGDYAPAVARGARDAGLPAGDIMIGSKEELAARLMTWLPAGSWVLVKGSRGMAMETVVVAICEGSKV